MKKLLCMALALCLVFALAACGDDPSPSTSGGDSDVITDGSTPTDLTTVTSPTPTPDPEPINTLTVYGINIIINGQVTGVGISGVSYEDGKLTITDVTYQNDSADAPFIYFEGGDLEIVVSGEVTLASDTGAAVIGNGGDEALTISGDGTLNLSATGGPGPGRRPHRELRSERNRCASSGRGRGNCRGRRLLRYGERRVHPYCRGRINCPTQLNFHSNKLVRPLVCYVRGGDCYY